MFSLAASKIGAFAFANAVAQYVELLGGYLLVDGVRDAAIINRKLSSPFLGGGLTVN